MKVAVLADVHANAAALEVVLADVADWGPDRVLVGGDVVNRGPQPVECLERVLEAGDRGGWLFVTGNHEEFVLREGRMPAAGRPAWEAAVCGHSAWTFRQLGARAARLEDWAFCAETAEGVCCVHASMRSTRHGIYPEMEDGQVLALVHPTAAVTVVGHTHAPFVRRIGARLVVNTGSVGLPFDGDPRASYTRLTCDADQWEAEIVRLPYDRGATERAYEATGYAEEGGPMVPLIREELRTARSRLSRWHREYEDAVAAGAMSVEESVRRMLFSC